MRHHAATALALAMLGTVGPLARPARGQAPSRPLVPELRVDAVVTRATAVQGGVGLSVPAGDYLRLALVAGAGPRLSGETHGLSARLDALGRFVLDPDASRRWGVYAAGGASLRYEGAAARDDWRVFLALAVGLEGARRSLGAPFVEVGYGGGLRVGLGLRRSPSGRR